MHTSKDQQDKFAAEDLVTLASVAPELTRPHRRQLPREAKVLNRTTQGKKRNKNASKRSKMSRKRNR